MESSENPATPAALRRHASLVSQGMSRARQEATHLGITKQKTLADNDGPRGPVHDFKGFLGPSTPQAYEVYSEASDGPRALKRCTRDINVLSHALRQCRQKEDQFPPIQSSHKLQEEIRLAMERPEKSETQEEISDLRRGAYSPTSTLAHSACLDAEGMHCVMANAQRIITAHSSPRSSLHRAASPPFKTRMIREMLPTISPNRGLVPKADAYRRGYHTAGDYSPSTKRIIDDMDKARCDLILLPTNQKLSIHEITMQTDRYKQIAGHRTFSIRFDEPTESAAGEGNYQRRPYLLQKSSDRRRRAPSPAAFNAVLGEMQTKKMSTLHLIGKNNCPQSIPAVDLEPSSSIESMAAGVLEHTEASQSVDKPQDTKPIGHNNSVRLPLMNNIPCSPFPII